MPRKKPRKFDLDSIHLSTNLYPDELAKKEQHAFKNQKEIDHDLASHQHYWDKIIINCQNVGDIVIHFISVIIIVSAATVWAWHLFTPIERHFLTPQQLDVLKDVMIAGGIFSYFKTKAG